MLTQPTLVQVDAIERAPVHHEPYSYFCGADFFRPEMIGALSASFPDIRKPGFLTVEETRLGPLFRGLIGELEGEVVTRAVSGKLGFDLSPYPRLTTIRKFSQARDGRAHTDGESKLATLLLYMNETWAEPAAGCLRVLRSADMNDYAAEIPPTMGSIFGFLRSAHSWHGHPPFTGERRVVQVTWLRSTADVDRKKRSNALSQVLKGVFGR